jgi:predicted DNA-binding protein
MPQFKDEQIAVKITTKYKSKLKKLADEKGITLSELLRHIIMTYIENEDNRKNI